MLSEGAGELGRLDELGTLSVVDAFELFLVFFSCLASSSSSSSSSSSVLGVFIAGGSGELMLGSGMTERDFGFTVGLSAFRLSDGVGEGDREGIGEGDGVAIGVGNGVAGDTDGVSGMGDVIGDSAIVGTGSSRMFAGVEGRLSGVCMPSFGSSSIGVRERKFFEFSSGFAGSSTFEVGDALLSFPRSSLDFFKIPA